MERIKMILSNIDKKDFKRYTIFSILLIITIIAVSTLKLTQARYESKTRIVIGPTIAFFVVDVESQTKQVKLDGIVPSTTPYLYTFNVSNFDDDSQKKANVDLTYSIEIITTTNMPLDFKIFKGSDMEQNRIDADEFTTDENGVYYRHLRINGVSVMNYTSKVTDVYTLWVEFPIQYKANPDAYAGIIDLVDIKIDAEQVV